MTQPDTQFYVDMGKATTLALQAKAYASLVARQAVTPTPAPAPTPAPTPVPTPAPVPALTTYGGGPTGTLTPYTGPTTITVPTTIANAVITQALDIRAAVTMSNVDIAATGYAILRINVGGSLDISDFRINGTGGPQNEGGIIGDNVTAKRGEIFGVENGIVPGSNWLVEDVYIHDLAHVGAAHTDGVQMDGGNNNVTLRRLRVVTVPYTDTSAVMIDNYYGASSGIVLDSLILSGGDYTLYLDGGFNSSPIGVKSITNCVFTNPGYGDVMRRGPVTVSAQSGNISNSVALTI